ncbi:MAG: ABC transporter permease [Clostridia bacterium]|nr:ABC transporter permease [Clostridia bacterium]
MLVFLNALPGDVAQGLIWGIMAIGVFITYKILDVADLTVDGTMCTGGAVCVVLMLGGMNPWLALVCAFLAGLAAGLVTGLLHTFCGIPAILAGILTQLALYSVNLRILSGANKAISVDKYPLLVSTRYVTTSGTPFYQHPIFVVAVFVLVVVGLLYWFFGTELGCSLRATGANPNMARAQGISTNFNKVLGLMVSNGLVALCSALLAQYNGFADVNMGRGAIVIGLAAVIIGEVLFSKLFRNFALRLVGVALGAIIYYVVYRIVMCLGLKTDDMKLITAVIVALFLSIPYWKGRYFSKPGKKGDKANA